MTALDFRTKRTCLYCKNANIHNLLICPSIEVRYNLLIVCNSRAIKIWLVRTLPRSISDITEKCRTIKKKGLNFVSSIIWPLLARTYKISVKLTDIFFHVCSSTSSPNTTFHIERYGLIFNIYIYMYTQTFHTHECI